MIDVFKTLATKTRNPSSTGDSARLKDQCDLPARNSVTAIGIQHIHAEANTIEVLGSWSSKIPTAIYDNNVLLVKIEGPVLYPIYHYLLQKGLNKPLYESNNQWHAWRSMKFLRGIDRSPGPDRSPILILRSRSVLWWVVWFGFSRWT